jgi:predicted transcriptional regulator
MSQERKYQEMTKAQLISHIHQLEEKIDQLVKSRQRSGSRKFEVLELLSQGPISILDIANRLNISSKNVSSLLCYLKKDKWGLIVNEEGQRMLTKHEGKDVDKAYVRNYIDSHKVNESEKAETSEEEASEEASA